MPDVTRIIEQTATESIYNDDWAMIDRPTEGEDGGTRKILVSKLKELFNDGLASSEELETVVGNIADTYNTSESYVVDYLCIHENALYKCIGATTGTWDSTKWQATTIAEIIATIDLSAESISYDNTSSGLEAENVQDAIDETITKLSAVGSSSGAIATFDDGSDLPMPSLKVAIEPQQDLHGYDNPWVGGSGKNKLNWDAWKGLPVINGTAVYENNGVTLTATSSDAYTAYSDWEDNRKIKVSEGETITLSWEETTNKHGYVYIFPNGGPTGWVVMDNANGKEVSYTVDSGITFITFRFGVRISGETISYKNIMVRKSGDSTWQPYSNICPISGWSEVNVTVADDIDNPTVENVYTIDLDGTRYGGTLDVVSGELVVDRVSITVDENSNIISGSGVLPFRIDLLTGAEASSSASALTGVKCNFLKEVTQSSSWGVDGTFSRVTIDAKTVYFKVNSEITTTQQLKTFLQSNNLQFVYELATPITIQLTPTQVKSLLGVNNVWADTGDVLDAEYIRDMTTIINSLIARIEALENQ